MVVLPVHSHMSTICRKILLNVLVIRMDAGQVAYPYKVVHSEEANEEDHKSPKQKQEPASHVEHALATYRILLVPVLDTITDELLQP